MFFSIFSQIVRLAFTCEAEDKQALVQGGWNAFSDCQKTISIVRLDEVDSLKRVKRTTSCLDGGKVGRDSDRPSKSKRQGEGKQTESQAVKMNLLSLAPSFFFEFFNIFCLSS